MAETILPERFNSPTYGELDWQETLSQMVAYIGQDVSGQYELIIGTDSEARNNGHADFVSALIVHKNKSGGIYFWGRQTKEHLYSLKQRILLEANTSLILAQKLVGDFAALGLLDLNLEIHVDVGPNGPTRELISEIVGMIRANGFRVATKPSSWGASHVADRHV